MNHTHDRYAELGVLPTEPADLGTGPLEPATSNNGADSIVVEDDVPLPPARGSALSMTKALERLEVGQSFLFPKSRVTSLRTAVWVLKRQTGRTFTTRTIDDENVRVWRTA